MHDFLGKKTYRYNVISFQSFLRRMESLCWNRRYLQRERLQTVLYIRRIFFHQRHTIANFTPHSEARKKNRTQLAIWKVHYVIKSLTTTKLMRLRDPGNQIRFFSFLLETCGSMRATSKRNPYLISCQYLKMQRLRGKNRNSTLHLYYIWMINSEMKY